MALFRCKMCGGTLEITDQSVAVCEYCGTKQTLPKLADDKKATLYDRANHFRRNNEFDKAMALYEQILNDDPEDSESYWSIVLCRYGIEYVEDPVSHKRVPTVNRAQYTSIFADVDYKNALKYADDYQRSIYEEEAQAIDEIQKGILAISAQEEPFDVFICYKETDMAGRRAPDSVYAQEIYNALTKEGYKVFFSRITLEDKLGTAYEPYIFSALNSAKVMIAVGTKPEHFNAVWVKNEWSRYLALIRAGEKKTLIPAYRDMSPYDLPEEFAYLQAQDMGKIGYVQDIVHGVQKLIAPAEKKAVGGSVENIVDATIGKAKEFLEKGDFSSAELSVNAVRGYDPTNAMAFIYQLMIKEKITHIEKLADINKPLENIEEFQNAVKYADSNLKVALADYNKSTVYNYALTLAQKSSKSALDSAIDTLSKIHSYKDSAEKIAEFKARLTEVEKASKKKANTLKMVAFAVAFAFAALIGFNTYQENQRLKAEAEAVVAEANRIINGISDNGENTIALGEYFTTSNGKKPSDLKWIVLEAKDNKVLLLSEKVIDAHKYSSKSDETVTWENSDVRGWLNNDFINTAFTPAEQLLLCETTIDNNEGNTTKDKVFLLSEAEITSYLPENLDRKAGVTSKARAGGVGYLTDGTKTVGPYMLRDITYNETSNGSINACAKTVDYRGDLGVTNKIRTNANNGGIRPAMWISLEEIK